MTLNVLHIDTERGWRGGERQALWLAQELSRRGQGTVVAARRGEPLAARAIESGLEVIPCNPSSEIDPRAALACRTVIKSRRIDVVHAHTAHAVAVAALATVGTGVPFVVSRRVDFKLRDNVGTRIKYGRAAKFIAISEAVARVLETGGIARERIAVVPDGVDTHRVVEPAPSATLSALGVPPNAPVVVQVAQLVGHKDPLNFVRAMARVHALVPEAHGLLVGDGPLRADVQREIEKLALGDVVHLAGYRTDADELLAAASVACLSSSEEGMGSVLLDALVFGRPIAATRAGGIPEVIIDDESGLLAPVKSPDALGDAIARLLRDPSLAARVSANAKERAASFSVGVMADRTMVVYDQVTAASR